MYPTREQFRKEIEIVTKAKRVLVENKVLKAGLKLTEEEMERARDLANMARQSSVPDQFLAALVNLTHKPLFLPCSCWWCRVRRWIKRIGEWG